MADADLPDCTTEGTNLKEAATCSKAVAEPPNGTTEERTLQETANHSKAETDPPSGSTEEGNLQETDNHSMADSDPLGDTTEDRSLQQAARCPMCAEFMRDSSQLFPCMHTFCTKCISKLNKYRQDRKTGCPLCREIVQESAARPTCRPFANGVRSASMGNISGIPSGNTPSNMLGSLSSSRSSSVSGNESQNVSGSDLGNVSSDVTGNLLGNTSSFTPSYMSHSGSGKASANASFNTLGNSSHHLLSTWSPSSTSNLPGTEFRSRSTNASLWYTGKRNKLLTSDPMCEICHKYNAISKCLECNLDICGECTANHARIPSLQKHNVLLLDDISEEDMHKFVFCDDHPMEKIKVNCILCNKAICSVCKLEKHDTHQSEPLQSAIDRHKETAKVVMDAITHKITDKRQKVTSLEKKCQILHDTGNKVKSAIKTQKDQLINQFIAKLESDADHLYNEVDQTVVSQIKGLQLKKREMSAALASEESTSTWVKGVLDNTDCAGLLKDLQSGLAERIDKLQQQLSAVTDTDDSVKDDGMIQLCSYTPSEKSSSVMTELTKDILGDVKVSDTDDITGMTNITSEVIAKRNNDMYETEENDSFDAENMDSSFISDTSDETFSNDGIGSQSHFKNLAATLPGMSYTLPNMPRISNMSPLNRRSLNLDTDRQYLNTSFDQNAVSSLFKSPQMPLSRRSMSVDLGAKYRLRPAPEVVDASATNSFRVVTFMDLADLKFKYFHCEKSVRIGATGLRMCLFYNKIWIPCRRDNTIRLYSLECDMVQVIKLSNIKDPVAMHPLHTNHLVLAASSGLYKLNERGHILSKIHPSGFDDVHVSGNFMVAFSHELRELYMWNVSESMCQFKGSFVVLLPLSHISSLFTVASHVFIGDYSGNKIHDYDMRGQCLKHYGTAGTQPGQFHSPTLCVTDQKKNLLVADKSNKRFQVILSRTGLTHVLNIERVMACDAFIVGSKLYVLTTVGELKLFTF